MCAIYSHNARLYLHRAKLLPEFDTHAFVLFLHLQHWWWWWLSSCVDGGGRSGCVGGGGNGTHVNAR